MLETQNLPLPLDIGRNTKQDEKLVDVNYGITVENVDYSIIGTVKKTNGIKNLVDQPFTSLLDAKSMASDENDLLVMTNPGELGRQTSLTYTSKWTSELDSPVSVGVKVENMGARIVESLNVGHQMGTAVDRTNNIAVYVSYYNTEGPSGTIFQKHIEFEDLTTGHRKVILAEGAARLRQPLVFTDSTSSTAFVIYKEQTALKIDYISYGSSSITGSITIDTTADEQYTFQAVKNGSTVRLFYFDASATNLKMLNITLSATPVVGSATVGVATNACNAAFITGELLELANGKFVFIYQAASSGGDDYVVMFVSSAFAILSETIFNNAVVASHLTSCISYLTSAANSHDLFVIYNGEENTVGGTGVDRIRINFSTNTATRIGSTKLLPFVTVTSRLFKTGMFVGRYRISEDDPGDEFLLGIKSTGNGNNDYIIQAYSRFNELQAAIPNDDVNLYQVDYDNSGNYYTTVQAFLDSIPNLRDMNARKIKISFNDTSYSSVKFGESIVIGGGFSSEFNGTEFMENGFHTTPWHSNSGSTSGGQMDGGTYITKVIFYYLDVKGQVTRSAESNAVTRTIAATTTGSITLQVNNLPFGQKAVNGYYIYAYRTLDGGSTFYLASIKKVEGNEAYNSRTTQIVLTQADASISSRETIYTTGGVLNNDPGPSFKYSTVIQDRLITAGGTDDNEVFFSKSYLFGECPNMSLEFSIRTDAGMVGGADPITGLGAIDDRVIIFKNNYIFYVQGNFPNELGQQYGLSLPTLISADVGCKNHKTIVNYPGGLMFQSEKGWYSLSGGMSLQYIGEGAEDFNSVTFTGGVLFPEKNQVRFSQANGNMLCFDYLVGKWFTRTNSNALSIGIYDDKFIVLRNDVGVRVDYETTAFEDDDQTTQIAEYYSTKIETSWIKMSGIQNFGRVRRAEILGKYVSPHTLRVDVYYDYDTSYVETYNYTHDPLDGIYQFKIHLAKQKCQAIKFVIYDTNQSSSGESMQLTNLTLEVGIRKGQFKINPDKQV